MNSCDGAGLGKRSLSGKRYGPGQEGTCGNDLSLTSATDSLDGNNAKNGGMVSRLAVASGWGGGG